MARRAPGGTDGSSGGASGARQRELDGDGGSDPTDDDIEGAIDAASEVPGSHSARWEDTVGGCNVGDAGTCGDPRYALGEDAPTVFEMAQAGYLAYLPIFDRAFTGTWSADHRYALGLAWGLLATNIDLVRWALCVATSDPTSGDCIEAYIRGERALRLVPKGGPCALPNGGGHGYNALTWVVQRDAILAALFVGDPLNLTNPASLAIVAGDLLLSDPEIWWCTMPGLPLDRSSRMIAEGTLADQNCGILTLAASLLHEMTHLCGREFVGERELTCDASYLTANYFVWGATARFPDDAGPSRCCQYNGRRPAIPSPGHEDMSGNFKNNDSCLPDVADAPTWVGPGVSGPFEPRGGDTPDLVPTPFDDAPGDPHIRYLDLDPQLSDSRPASMLLATASGVQAVAQQGVEIDW